MYDTQITGPDRPLLPIALRMAESLREFQRVLGEDGSLPSLVPAAEHLEQGGTLWPHAYGAYFALLRALQDDDEAALPPLVTRLAGSIRPPDAPIAIRMLGFEEFGRDGTRDARADFASSFLVHTQMRAVPAVAHVRMRCRLRAALHLIETLAPKAWRDVSQCTAEIIAAFGAPRGIMTFDGCSSLVRYGSILINMRRKRTPLVLAETLVHESAHSLLFALSSDDHRVLNPPTELHKSPLRLDPRPLDGIYHAVFVLARMHGFVAEIA